MGEARVLKKRRLVASPGKVVRVPRGRMIRTTKLRSDTLWAAILRWG